MHCTKSSLHAKGVNNKKELSAASVYLSWKLEKSIAVSLMYFLVIFLCCLSTVLGLKIPPLRSYLIWLWFCFRLLFLPTVKTVESSFHMISNYFSSNGQFEWEDCTQCWLSERESEKIAFFPPSTFSMTLFQQNLSVTLGKEFMT